MLVSPEVLDVLDRATAAGGTVALPEQLERRLYLDVDKVLRAAGGRWDRRVRAHLFDGDAVDALEQILLTGAVATPQEFGQFDSPPAVVARVIELARIRPGESVLEPSAGLGNLAAAALAAGGFVSAIELDGRRCDALSGRFGPRDTIACREADFLTIPPERVFDVVVMNPPFARQADLRHVRHAARFLRPSGRLVAVLSAGVRFRQTAAAVDFRAWAERHGGAFENLPPGSFKAAGTAVNACILALSMGD